MIKKFKNWLVNHFLPMWAKETILDDNKKLRQEVSRLSQELAKKEAYICGLENGIKSQRRIIINTSEVKK